MNTAKISRWMMALPALALGFSAPAMAHRVVHVEGTLYVIICEPGGQAYTFNGSQSGAGEVSGMLCPGMATNGSSGTGTGTVFVEATSAELAIKTKGLPVQRSTAPGQHTAAHEAAHTVQQGGTKPVRKDCPSGTHWYEPAKACVANGGHPSE
jgi:hypothetical protein